MHELDGRERGVRAGAQLAGFHSSNHSQADVVATPQPRLCVADCAALGNPGRRVWSYPFATKKNVPTAAQAAPENAGDLCGRGRPRARTRSSRPLETCGTGWCTPFRSCRTATTPACTACPTCSGGTPARRGLRADHEALRCPGSRPFTCATAGIRIRRSRAPSSGTIGRRARYGGPTTPHGS